MVQLRKSGLLLLLIVGGVGLSYGTFLIISSEIRSILYSNEYNVSFYQQPQYIPFNFTPLELQPANGTQTNIENFTITFTSMDVYAVDNPLTVSMNLRVKNPEIIHDVKLLLEPTIDDYSTLNSNNIKQFIDTRERFGQAIDLPHNGTYTFGKDQTFVFRQPMDVSFLILIHVVKDNHDMGYEKFRSNRTLISVLPYIYELQALSEENAQIQLLETNNTNNIVQGLTWIMVGVIPLGSAIQIIRGNQEKAERHRRDLHDGFTSYWYPRRSNANTLLEILEHFPDTRFYLEHICTGQPELDTSIRNLIGIEVEMRTLGTPLPRNLAIRHTNANADFNQQFQQLLNRMRQQSEDIGGICENCIKFYDIKGKSFRKMKSTLDSFTMPY